MLAFSKFYLNSCQLLFLQIIPSAVYKLTKQLMQLTTTFVVYSHLFISFLKGSIKISLLSGVIGQMGKIYVNQY